MSFLRLKKWSVPTVLLLAAACAGVAAPRKQADLPRVEQIVIEGTNQFRAGESRVVLRNSKELENAARAFAEYMARTGKFDHEVDGTTPASRVKAAGYQFCRIGENIARHYSTQGFDTPDLGRRLVESWKESPGHRHNMLEPDVIETGVAVVHKRHDGIDDFYAVQLFGKPRDPKRGRGGCG
jgi:uncharacterized protein YkwD